MFPEQRRVIARRYGVVTGTSFARLPASFIANTHAPDMVKLTKEQRREHKRTTTRPNPGRSTANAADHEAAVKSRKKGTPVSSYVYSD